MHRNCWVWFGTSSVWSRGESNTKQNFRINLWINDWISFVFDTHLTFEVCWAGCCNPRSTTPYHIHVNHCYLIQLFDYSGVERELLRKILIEIRYFKCFFSCVWNFIARNDRVCVKHVKIAFCSFRSLLIFFSAVSLSLCVNFAWRCNYFSLI